MSARVAAICLGSLFVAGVAAAQDATTGLDAARARWEAADLADYDFRYQKFCECQRHEPPVTVVSIRDGAVERVHHLHSGSAREVPARDGSLALYWTVDELFAKLATASERGAQVEADYDSELGYPVRLFIDYEPDLSGDETDLRSIRLERVR